MLAFNRRAKLLWCLLELLFILSSGMALLTSYAKSRCNSCLVFNFNMYWLLCCWLRLYGILWEPTIHSVVHHSSGLSGCHLRPIERIASTSWLLCTVLLLLLIAVLKCLVCNYISSNYSKRAWVFALSLLLLLIEERIVRRVVHLALVVLHWACSGELSHLSVGTHVHV